MPGQCGTVPAAFFTSPKPKLVAPIPLNIYNSFNSIFRENQMSSSEIVQIVDSENRETGVTSRAEMRKNNLIHRATYILVFNQKGELFIQKRTMTKDVFPGLWDIAAGGVVQAGESYDLSAKRELKEELGVESETLQHRFDYYYDTEKNKVWGRVYTCIHEGPFTLQAEEIDEGKFLSIDDIFTLHKTNPVTPDGMEILKRVWRQMKTPTYFLHGLDSSNRGTKGKYFTAHFPEMYSYNYSGSLTERNNLLKGQIVNQNNLTLIGSSFGGLMAACTAIDQPEKIRRLILLAPALNFEEFAAPREQCAVPTTIIIGRDDTVCPPDTVIPIAEATFNNLNIQLVDDDHMLHETFFAQDWSQLIYG